jgi:iron-sulfur cluster repair protein YtfE (RIC family)
MKTSELLTLLMEQHRQLREILAAIEEESVRVARLGAPRSCERLRGLLAELRRKLVLHTALERDALVPLLNDVDAWGPQRLQRLQREHDAEHEALERSITHTASTVSNEALAVAARALAEEIAMHMAIEERDFLNQGVLNDRAARVSPGA